MYGGWILIKKSHFMWIWKICFFFVLDWTMHWSYQETMFLVAILYQIKHLPWIGNLFGFHFCLFPPFFIFLFSYFIQHSQNYKTKITTFQAFINHGKNNLLGHDYIMVNATPRNKTRLIKEDSIIKTSLIILTITLKIIL